VLAELLCPGCGRKSYNPASERIPACPDCGQEPQVVDTFRDRRRVPAPVKRDRRRPSDPALQQPEQAGDS
jgi:ribosomal protein L37AE/L43A